MRMLNNYLAIELIEEESKSAIINPDEEKKKTKGKAMHVSEKVDVVSEGDVVYFSAISPIEIGSLHIIKEEQIVAIV